MEMVLKSRFEEEVHTISVNNLGLVGNGYVLVVIIIFFPPVFGMSRIKKGVVPAVTSRESIRSLDPSSGS
jgi:hypothetical protein